MRQQVPSDFDRTDPAEIKPFSSDFFLVTVFPTWLITCAMEVSVKQLEEAVAIRKQIDQLRSRLASLLAGSSAPSQPAGKRRGGLSASGRERIAAAARARWARAKAAVQLDAER